MDPKRKKIYIILTIACFGLSAAILAWNFLGNSVVPIPAASGTPAGSVNVKATDNFSSHAATGAVGNFSEGFSAPQVFPATDVFDTETLDSNDFKSLMDYTPLSITGEIGRDNPFKNY